MKKSILNFITDSFLFQKKAIDNHYLLYNDDQLEKELERYRTFCLEYASEKQTNKQNLNVLVQGTDYLPDETFLKQTALYVHQIILNDPVFGFSSPKSSISETMNQYLGMEINGYDRTRISNSAKYITSHKKAIQSGFVDFLPLSFFDEPPREIPIKYSEVLFSDILPKDILNYFHQNAKVTPIQNIDGKLIVDPKVPLFPCRAINISFPDHKQSGFPYMLFKTKITDFNEDTGEAKLLQILPKTAPSTEVFENWVTQSINQASRRYFDTIYREIILATNLGTTYLTHSEFDYQLLQKSVPLSSDIQTDVLNLTMDLDLPLLENVSLQHILDIREKDGETFEDFRLELEKKLRTLRLISDPEELKTKLENLTHELTNVQIREINKKISNVKSKMFPDAMILVGGLITTIQTNGWGLPALIYAIQNGYKTYQEYLSEVKNNPSFFLWKVANKS